MSRKDTEPAEGDDGVGDDGSDVRERLEREADRAIEGFDEGIVDLLSWVLDTETRARIFVFLREQPDSTSEEVADGTGLYPSTVREALAELHEEGKVTREKRENSGAGNNPYEYSAMAPSDLVGEVVEDVQAELNTVFNLDRYLGDESATGNAVRDSADGEPETDPVRITVEDAPVGDSGSAEEDHEPPTHDDGDATQAGDGEGDA